MHCPECWHDIPADAAYCSRCGYDLHVTRAAPRPVEPIRATTAPLPYAEPTRPPRRSSRLSPLLLVALGAAMALSVLVIIGVGLLSYFEFYATRGEDARAERPTVNNVSQPAPKQTATPTATVAPTPAQVQTYQQQSTDPQPAIVSEEVWPVTQSVEHRIKFPRGAYSVLVRDSIARLNRYYVLRAVAGQTMSISLRTPESDAGVMVNYGDGQEQVGQAYPLRPEWESVLPSSGDYHIIVDCGSKRAGRVTPIEMVISFK